MRFIPVKVYRELIHFLADIKGFLADVKPALLSALDAEYEKNPYEVWAFLCAHLSLFGC